MCIYIYSLQHSVAGAQVGEAQVGKAALEDMQAPPIMITL